MVADCGSYNITTYIRTKEKRKIKIKIKKQRERKERKTNYIEITSRMNHYLSDTFMEGESSRIIFQESYKIT